MTAAPLLEHDLDVDDGTRVRWTSLGRRLLVAWLAANDVSSGALAADLKVTGGAIRNLTSGRNAEPALSLALALYKRTGVTPDSWLTDRSQVVTMVTGHGARLLTMPNEKEIAEKLARDGSAAGGELLRSGVAEVEKSLRDQDAKSAEGRARYAGKNPETK